MAYQVTFTDATNPAKPSITVEDQALNTQTSLTFVGKNYAGYAPEIAKSFLHLLENFANNNAPSNPVEQERILQQHQLLDQLQNQINRGVRQY